MIALLAAALLAAAPPSEPYDTVFTSDGGRITGIVIEEGPTSGVTIQLPDGKLRRIEPAQVVRVDFADGTVSAPRTAPATSETAPAAPAVAAQPPPGPREPSPSAAAPPPAPRALDNVYFVRGGRVRGTVIEETARAGVTVRLLDGSVKTYPRDELVRIEYADGSVSRRASAPAPRAAPLAPVAQPPPPQPLPPQLPPPALVPVQSYPQAYPRVAAEPRPPPYPLYLSLGVGASFLGGDASRTVPMGDVVKREQGHLSAELGLRLAPSFAIGVYGDVTGGDPAPAIQDQCRTDGVDCTGTTAHGGFLVRHTWSPSSSRPTWLSLGTGWEVGGVVVDRHASGGSRDLVRYRGREWLRVGTGVDFRSSDVLALGFYGTFAVGEYDSYRDPAGVESSVDRATHTTAQVGVRLTLFP